MQKISAQINKKNLVWLGIRESDIDGIRQTETGFPGFRESVTIFGSGANGNHAMEKEIGKRIDHNGDCSGFEDYFQASMEELVSNYPDISFFPYDALDYEAFPIHLQEHIIARNDYGLLDQLEQKLYLREYYSSIVHVPTYEILQAGDCTWDSLERLFPNTRNFVLQRDYSCGGSGTYLVRSKSKDGKPCHVTSERLDYSDGNALSPRGFTAVPLTAGIPKEERILVSPYFEHNISINIHTVIYREVIYLFAPSVQLIDQKHEKLEYLGSDFSALSQIDELDRNKIMQVAETVSRDLQSRGYRGVCGIDMILAGGECYFMEVNARFQASSAILNKDLRRKGFPSLQEYHLDAFNNEKPSLPVPPHSAEGSFITIHVHKREKQKVRWFWEQVKRAPGFEVVDDWIDWEGGLEENCYAFQLHCRSQISSVTFQHSVRIHPNVTLTTFEPTGEKEYHNILLAKILMLARGVFVTHEAWKLSEQMGGLDWEEFDAVTLKLWDSVWVTTPCIGKWETLSPLHLEADLEKKEFWLSLYGERLVRADAMKADPNAGKVSTGGHYYGDIVYMNPDRLRVYHRDGCIYQDRDVGCKFCDLRGTGKPLTFQEIEEALDLYWDNLCVDHFLIGGGSGPAEEEYRSVIRIAQYIRAHSDKHIYLMTTPIKDTARLATIKRSGITEVSFNIEIFDRETASEVMPGKSTMSMQYYLESLQKASAVFGRAGEVRCAVVVGFDDLDTFAAGIRKICEAGAAPILSLYRICPDTELENYMPIDEKEALIYYNIACEISKEYGLKPGPTCKACQNNTMALDL